MILKLTRDGDRKFVYVRYGSVLYFEKAGWPARGFTYVVLMNSVTILVKETPEEIMKLITEGA